MQGADMSKKRQSMTTVNVSVNQLTGIDGSGINSVLLLLFTVMQIGSVANGQRING
jgi:hypothetical protein